MTGWLRKDDKRKTVRSVPEWEYDASVRAQVCMMFPPSRLKEALQRSSSDRASSKIMFGHLYLGAVGNL